MRFGSSFLVALASISAVAVACSIPASNDRFVQTKQPDEATFAPVSLMLTVRCGSLDCHGNIARNLRIYGSAGRRFAATDQPFSPLCDTADEVTQTYTSVVGLEPEQISAVAGGADPGTLTMVRKARGSEAHKGEQIWSQGDDSDVCLSAWLTGAPNSAACGRAVKAVIPSSSTNPLLQCIAP